MLFNSAAFLAFLPLCVLGYYLLPHRMRWLLLLVASYYFYMSWEPRFGLLIGGATLAAWAGGLWMEGKEGRARIPGLVLGLAANLGMLLVFKYTDFFIESSNRLLGTQIGLLGLALPVGISFFTFQALSYTIDVYRGQVSAERHLGHFALFIVYFPQLVAGPIERYDHLAPQLRAEHTYKYDNIARGFRLVLFGLFVKMVVADNLAPHVDAVYRDPSAWNGGSLATALLFYAFQIYADFHGYSLVAVGAARMMGITLMANFQAPYLSSSVAGFWRRWHISLSNWIRDYLYNPLALFLRDWRRWGIAAAIITAFTLNGMWHGADWTFLAWGLLHGLVLASEALTQPLRKRLFKPLPPLLVNVAGWAFTVGFWVMSLTLFRATGLSNLKHLLKGLWNWPGQCDSLAIPWTAWAALGVLACADLVLRGRPFDIQVGRLPLPLRWLIYAALLYGVLLFASTEEIPFIYFRF